MTSLKQQAEQGFSIVELLVIVVIIGVLGGILLTTYNGVQQKNHNSERQSDLNSLQRQLEIYFTENGRYPSLADLGTSSTRNVTFVHANMKGLNKESLRDPKAPSADYALASKPTPHEYSYAPTQSDGSTCDNTGSKDCTKYVLTAEQEGGGPNLVFKNLN